MNATSKIKLLLVGLDEKIGQLVISLLGDTECRLLRSSEELVAFLDDPMAAQFQIALAGSAILDHPSTKLLEGLNVEVVGLSRNPLLYFLMLNTLLVFSAHHSALSQFSQEIPHCAGLDV